MKLAYNRKLHNTLRASCPDGYCVQITREGKQLFTFVSCEDSDYFAPWLFAPILEPFEYDRQYI